MQRFVLRGAGLSMSVRIAGVALSYAANVLLSRLLGVQAFGEYVIALSWALVLTLIAKAGFDNSALRYSTIYFEKADFGAWRGFIRFAVAAVVLFSLAIATLMLLGGHGLIPVSAGTRLWAAMLVLPLALLAFFSVVLRTTRGIVAAQFYEQILRPLVIVVGAGCAALGGVVLHASSAMALTATAACVALIVLLIQLASIMRRTRADRPRFAEWPLWLSLSAPMLALTVVQEMLNQIDIILLGHLSDAKEAALFAASWRLASLVPFALSAFSTMAGPLIAAAYDRGATDELHRVSSLVARLGFAFAVVAALVLYLFGRPLLALFGRDFTAANSALLVLLIGGVVNAFTGIVAYLATLTGRERVALGIFAGALVVSVGLNIILIPRFGAVGAAIASSSGTAAWNLAMLLFVRRSVGIDASALALAPRRIDS